MIHLLKEVLVMAVALPVGIVAAFALVDRWLD